MGVDTNRLFFGTDVHGSENCFLKFLNSPRLYKADIVILGGDLAGKTLVPIVRGRDGRYQAQFLGRVLTLTSEKEVEVLLCYCNLRGHSSHGYRFL